MTDPEITEVRNATMLHLRATLLRDVEKQRTTVRSVGALAWNDALVAVEALIKKVCT